jgi:BMFP domain-containing protein YqiC
MDQGRDMSEYVGQDSGTLKVTIREAAARLGVTEAAIRKRIQRGSLGKEMGQDGRVYVSLDLSQDKSHPESQVESEALVESLQDQITFLRTQLDVRAEEIQRRDVIISQLTQANAALAARVPELEAAESHSEGAESAADPAARASPTSNDTAEFERSEQRPWWRRIFGQ